MRRIFLIISICLVCHFCANAQIRWLETSHDFGTFQDTDGPQSYTFMFVNEGDKPVMINKVRTSCGCTAATYTKGEICPGDTAKVDVSYDPKGMMGRFEKSAKVYVGSDNQLSILFISGKVLTTGRVMKARYPYKVGPLYLNRDSVWMGDVTHGTVHTEYIHAFNSSQDTLHISLKDNAGGFQTNASQYAVEPGDLVTISVYYNSISALKDGPDVSGFTLYADEQRHPEWCLYVPVGANVIPPAETLSHEQISNAARIAFEPTLIDLGKVRADKEVTIKFRVTNEGKSTLELNRIYATDLASACPLCPVKNFRVDRFPERVKPGKSVEIKGKLWLDEVTTLGTQGAFNLMIEVKCNDPRHPRSIGNVHITGQIVE